MNFMGVKKMYEAVVLAGGKGWRLKPDVWIPKPLVPLNGKESLLEWQVKWLLNQHQKFGKVVIATNRDVVKKLEGWLPLSPRVEFNIEENNYGTAGAVKGCLERLGAKYVYVMNVDDMVLDFQPLTLLEKAEDRGAALLIAKPKLPFGRVIVRGDYAYRFQEKPGLDFYVSVGHYVFKQCLIEKFPDEGSLEKDVLPKLAKERKLSVIKWKGKWVTINTYKDYLSAKELIQTR